MTWAEITDEMIAEKAKALEEGCSGHVFHVPWSGEKTNGYVVEMGNPAIMKEWLENNK